MKEQKKIEVTGFSLDNHPNDDYQKIMLNTMKICDGVITEFAEKYFKTEKEKIDYIISAGVNLLANMCVNMTADKLEAYVKNSTDVMKALSEWFDKFIAHKRITLAKKDK